MSGMTIRNRVAKFVKHPQTTKKSDKNKNAEIAKSNKDEYQKLLKLYEKELQGGNATLVLKDGHWKVILKEKEGLGKRIINTIIFGDDFFERPEKTSVIKPGLI